MKKTSLDAGSIIFEMLSNDREVMKRANKVFPVSDADAKLPYVIYRRSELEHSPAKPQGADAVTMNVQCFAAKYRESVELAEAVRAALDYKEGSIDGLRMRSCTLVGGSEDWGNNAYVQELVFNIKI